MFQKEVDRFRTILEPLAPWLLELLRWTDEGRLAQALAWARSLQLAVVVTEGTPPRLQLTPEGHQWLSSGLDAQYAGAYGLLNPAPTHDRVFWPHWRLFATGPSSYGGGGSDDTDFLGETIVVLKPEKGKHHPGYWQVKPEDLQALRTALDRALAALEPGIFYRLDSVISHLVFGEHNPVNLGLALDQVIGLPVQPACAAAGAVARGSGPGLDRGLRDPAVDPPGLRPGSDRRRREGLRGAQRRLDAYFGRKVNRADRPRPRTPRRGWWCSRISA